MPMPCERLGAGTLSLMFGRRTLGHWRVLGSF